MEVHETSGVRIAYDEFGSAADLPTVVLIHAFPLNRSMWQPQVERLARSYHLLVPDLRGHGDSGPASGRASMRAMADDLASLVATRSAGRVVLVGLSMGGYVAFEFVRNNHEMVCGLVLADTRSAADSEETRKARQAMIEEVEHQGPEAIVDSMITKLLAQTTRDDSPEVERHVREMILSTDVAGLTGALAGMAERRDSTDLVRQLAMPTLVIVGSEDSVTPVAEARAMAQAIDSARFEVIEGAGHLSNLELPNEFNRHLESFLDEVSRTGRCKEESAHTE